MDCRNGNLSSLGQSHQPRRRAQRRRGCRYRSADRLHDERLDRAHDFTNKSGVVHSEVMLPTGSKTEWGHREQHFGMISRP